MSEDRNTVFTEEALKSQDSKKVPLTLETSGPVIGEATLEYIPGKGLNAKLKVHDQLVAESLLENVSNTRGNAR